MIQSFRLKRLAPLGMSLLIGLVGVAILFKDLLLAGSPNVLWANDFDPRLIYWIVNWGYHVLFEQRQPLEFWNANSFYPNGTTLAYSDSLLSLQLLFSPLRLLGIPPLSALYLSLAGTCLIGVVLTFHALGRIDALSMVERALITVAAHFSLSVTGFLIHYQLFGFQLAPAFFLFLYLYLRDLGQKDLLVLILLFAAGVTFAMYLAPMLFVLSICVSIPLVIKQLRHWGAIPLLQKIGIRGMGIVVVGILALYFIQVKPYLDIATAFPKQSLEETAIYSADLTALFTGFSKFSFWYGPTEYPAYGAWEYAFFPGYVLLSAALLFFVLWSVRAIIKFSRREGSRKGNPPLTILSSGHDLPGDWILYLAILLVFSIVLTWGPFFKPNPAIRLPFYYLAQFVPGFDGVRAPGRFGMLIGLPLAVFAVAFFRWVAANSKARAAIMGLALGLIAVESLPKFPVVDFSVDQTGIYQKVSQAIQPNTPLLELPVFGKDNFETIKLAMQELDGSTIHWGKMVVGYGAKTPPQYSELLDLDKRIQGNEVEPYEAVNWAKRYGISYVLVHQDQYSQPLKEKWQAMFRGPAGAVVFEDKGVVLLRLADSP